MSETKVMMIKLNTGEEIIGEVDEKTVLYNGRVTVRNPDRIILQPTQTGLGIVLLDFLPYAKDGKNVSIDISDNSIAFKFEEVSPELVKNYKERHSSILMPTQPIVNLRV